jgi:ribosomal protein S12 methylthiotransferase accessory factor YcaO
MVSMGDHFGYFSVSTMYSNALIPAFGEFLERKIAESNYRDRANQKATLSEIPDPILVRSISHMLSQVSLESKNIEKHEFEFTKCLNIITGEVLLAPRIFFSVSPSHKDVKHMPERDSSGGSIHSIPSESYQRSLFEYVERQSLIAAHTFKYHKNSILLKSEITRLKTTIRQLIEYFTSIGKLYLADISVFDGIYVIAAVFSSDYGPVKYAIGSSGHLDPNKALEKAILELYQSFVLMLTVHDSSDGINYETKRESLPPYSLIFCDSNHSKTVFEFSFSEKTNPITIGDFLDQNIGTLDYLHKSISGLTNYLLLFSMTFDLGSEIFIFNKVFSPDLFLSINVGGNINKQNNLTTYLLKSGFTFDFKPIPFP